MNSTTYEIQGQTTSSDVVSQEDVIIKGEEYGELLKTMNAIKAEHSFGRALLLCDQHWYWGKEIVEYQMRHQVGVSAFIRELKKDLKISERSLWFARKAAYDYPTIEAWHNALPDGKATSWSKAKVLLGGSPNEKELEPDLAKVAKGLIKRYGAEDARHIAEIVIGELDSQPDNA